MTMTIERETTDCGCQIALGYNNDKAIYYPNSPPGEGWTEVKWLWDRKHPQVLWRRIKLAK
jgi:hypothetical protein